jgi:mRNA interferase MazF
VKVARQGEVWFIDLEPTRGREQAGRRPGVVVSVDQLGTGPSGLAIVVPLTSTDHSQRLHVPIDPPAGGVRERSYAMPEMVRSISRERLIDHWGTLDDAALSEIARRVRLLVRDPLR